MCEELTFIKWLWIIEDSNWFGSIMGSIPVILLALYFEYRRRQDLKDRRGNND